MRSIDSADQRHVHLLGRSTLTAFVLSLSLWAAGGMEGQSSAEITGGAKLASIEVATIKPADHTHGGEVGYVGRPGGRVHLGLTTIETLISYAFGIPSGQISGIPTPIAKSEFDIVAVPPSDSPSRTAAGPPAQATPSREQREMLQSLLTDRFGLRYHRETKDGSVYLLLRGSGELQLKEAKDKTLDPRGAIMRKGGGIVDGEAFGTNLTMAGLARTLSSTMGRPVLDRTGLNSSYDFHLAPDNPENTDAIAATISAMRRLGLQLKAGRGPVETIVVDGVRSPSEN